MVRLPRILAAPAAPRPPGADAERQRDDLGRLRVLAHEMPTYDDPRPALVRGAAALLGAHAVALLEAGTDGFTVTAAHGAAGAIGHTGREPDLRALLGAQSTASRAVTADDHPAALLAAGWRGDRGPLDAHTTWLLDLLAEEAAVVLRRLASRRQLEQAAMTDPLTGVANRRAWDNTLHREMARAQRSGRPLGVALLDLNGFKLVNDTRGHEAGDRLLRAAVAAWGGVLRSSDVLGRLGGDEFAVVLPDCDSAHGAQIAERLRQVTPGAGGTGVGVAVWDGSEDVSALVRRTDAALYEDKSRAGHALLADPARLRAVAATGLLHGAHAELDRLSELVTWLLDVPVALVTLVTDERQAFPGLCGLSGWAAEQRGTPLSHSFCQHPVATGQPFVVDDARDNPLVADNQAIRDLGVVAYAGFPLADADGEVIGVLCAIDTRPRRWTFEEMTVLRQLTGRAAQTLTRAGVGAARPA